MTVTAQPVVRARCDGEDPEKFYFYAAIGYFQDAGARQPGGRRRVKCHSYGFNQRNKKNAREAVGALRAASGGTPKKEHPIVVPFVSVRRYGDATRIVLDNIFRSAPHQPGSRQRGKVRRNTVLTGKSW